MTWPFGLTPRDQAIIRFLARFKQASGKQLERLFFQTNAERSRETVRQRVLKRLARDEYLYLLPRKVGYGGGSELSHYMLGSAGLTLFGLPTPRYKWNPHTLMVTELMVRLTELLIDDRIGKLTYSPEPLVELTTISFKPDAYVEIERDRRYFW